MLRLGVDDKWLPEGLPHLPILVPFWGIPEAYRTGATLKRLDVLHERGGEFLRLSSLPASDVAVLPFDWQFALADASVHSHAIRAADEAQSAGKKILVFFFSDSEDEVPLENAIVFRTSMQKGARPNEFSHPAWIDDHFGTNPASTDLVRQKEDRPTVGFCGFAGYRLLPDSSWDRRLRALARYVYRGFPPPTVRERAIAVLRRSRQVETRFVLRENFFAGVADASPEDQRQVRDSFLENLQESDYVLCARGGGNFSYRFYETLAAGRIPVLVDTNCALPFDFEVDYGQYGPIIDAESVSRIAVTIEAFHHALSSDDFIDLQRRCRRLWDEYLSPMGFFRNLHLCLERVEW